MDKIRIEELVCQARVGVPEEERREPQKILIDVELEVDLQKAGRGDQMELTVDYAAATLEVKKVAEGRPFVLVEAIAESAAERLLAKFKVEKVTVRVRKFSVPGTSSVGVQIVRASTGSARTKV